MSNLNKLEEKLDFLNNTVMEIYCNANNVRVVKLTTNDKQNRKFHKKFIYGVTLKEALENTENYCLGKDAKEYEVGSDANDSYLDLMLTKGFKIRIFSDKTSNLHFNIQSENDAIIYLTDLYKSNLSDHFNTAEEWAKEVLETLGFSLIHTVDGNAKANYSRTTAYKTYTEEVRKK